MLQIFENVKAKKKSSELDDVNKDHDDDPQKENKWNNLLNCNG